MDRRADNESGSVGGQENDEHLWRPLLQAAGAQETTGLPWQKVMAHAGLIERGPRELDLRKQVVRLTDNGRNVLEQYLTRILIYSQAAPAYPDRAGG